MRALLAALLLAVTLVLGAAGAPTPAAAHPGHASCAGGITVAPALGAPAPGDPGFGAFVSGAARGASPAALGGPGLRDEVALFHAALCEPT